MASATSENFYTDMNGVFQVVTYNGVSLSREGGSVIGVACTIKPVCSESYGPSWSQLN